ncbi:unnamed protein product [Amaranthus hypochondriacus]
MDPRVQDYFGITNGNMLQLVNDNVFPVHSNGNIYLNGLPNLRNGFMGHNSNTTSNSSSTSRDVNGVNSIFPDDPSLTNVSSISSLSHEENFLEDCDFSDSVLKFINQILVEEDVEGKECMLQESLQHQALQGAQISNFHPQLDSQPNLSYFSPNFNDRNSILVDPNWVYEQENIYDLGFENPFPLYQPLLSSSCPSSVDYAMDGGLMGSHPAAFGVPETCHGFLPIRNYLFVSDDANGLPEKLGVSQDLDEFRDGWRVRKNGFRVNLDTKEERSSKQAAIYEDSNVRSDMFDKVLLHHGGDQNELVMSLRTTLRTATVNKTEISDQSKGSIGGKGRGRNRGGRKEMVDLRTLLITCAQAVATDDRRTANELLKQIRQHSSPLGDGNQRLAHYLADGLEARLAGMGSQIYKALTSQRTAAADVLKAYLLYLAACPFRKLSNFFSNKSIAKRTRKAAKIHIIDFGILYGFQWPTFIQRQSMREGGPPRIKITGIDFPQPGFRPAERVEETGRRLENYAHEFGVPFEYRAIAKRWDTIVPEDFDIDEDEVVVVNCIYRLKNMPDETVCVESSRNIVLKLIRKLNPNFFIHGVVNGAYSAPFFVTRFREALFHFSAQFDVLETVVPREYDERMLIERDLLAREALNVIACEGWERVERPETYKQWKIRLIRAGFTQLPLDSEIKERALMQVHSAYHKDFMTDEDSRWLLLGWRGRVLFALSTWQPA